MLHIGKNNPCYEYTIKENGVTKTLDTTESEKDLGVFIDPLLSFKDHILFIVKKARSLSGLIIRSIEYKCIDNMVPLFKSIVRPILETSEAVWNPYMRKFIDMIESVQRHFTKYVIGMRNLSYEERLKSLKLPSLEFRRFRGDLIEIFKICHNLYDPKTTDKLIDFNLSNTRAHKFKLLKKRVNTTQFLNFFTNRIVNPWNKLPPEIVNAGSVNSFKNCLDKYYKEHLYSIKLDIV